MSDHEADVAATRPSAHELLSDRYCERKGQIPSTQSEAVEKGIPAPTPDVARQIVYFKHPDNLFAISSIIDGHVVVPEKIGVYGWYFDERLPLIPDGPYFRAGQWELMYIGISGSETSKGNLQKRIVNKHLSCPDRSSLRTSIGCLLHQDSSEQRHLVYQRKPWTQDSWYFGDKGEEALTIWLRSHATVAWITCEDPDVLETEILNEYGHVLPLNYSKNPANAFRKQLRALKKAMKAE